MKVTFKKIKILTDVDEFEQRRVTEGLVPKHNELPFEIKSPTYTIIRRSAVPNISMGIDLTFQPTDVVHVEFVLKEVEIVQIEKYEEK